MKYQISVIVEDSESDVKITGSAFFTDPREALEQVSKWMTGKPCLVTIETLEED